jgi:hypothetical protein
MSQKRDELRLRNQDCATIPVRSLFNHDRTDKDRYYRLCEKERFQ